ncbi:MAG: branched-chain amino acid transaminase [Pseudomonadaceae bacterium]|nr:branched-chain amino acid transaminase [Pseudomonadaceae bacterium]
MPTLADRDGFIWMDGQLVPWREAQVHVLTHTLHYGMGVFEGVRAYDTPRGTCIFRLAEHTKRLYQSAHILNMTIPFPMEELIAAQREVFRANELNEGYMRPIVFLGSEGLGLRADNLTVRVSIAAWPWPSYMDPELKEKGIVMRASSYTRHHVNITMCKAKSVGNYTNSMLALQEALSGGADEALMLDPEGYVAEGSGENIFVLRDGVLHTPELTSCLDGITRDTVFHLAKDMGIDILERRITRDELYIADEVFLTGTAAEVMPVREIDGRKIGNGARGPVTEQLQSTYFDLVRGQRSDYGEWLTPC